MKIKTLNSSALRQYYEDEAAIIGRKKTSMYGPTMRLQERLWKERIRVINEHISVCRSFLDIGCAEGYFGDEIKALFGSDVFYVGLDISMNYIRLGDKNTGKQFIQGDAQALPFSDSAFDVVMISEVLEHLPDPFMAVQEGLRVAGGFVLITTPRRSIFRWALDKLGFSRNPMKLGLGHISELGMGEMMEYVAKTHARMVSSRLDCYLPNGVTSFLHLSEGTVVWLDRVFHTIPLIKTKCPLLQIFLLSK